MTFDAVQLLMIKLESIFNRRTKNISFRTLTNSKHNSLFIHYKQFI